MGEKHWHMIWSIWLKRFQFLIYAACLRVKALKEVKGEHEQNAHNLNNCVKVKTHNATSQGENFGILIIYRRSWNQESGEMGFIKWFCIDTEFKVLGI